MITQTSIPARNVNALASHLTSPVTGIVRRLRLHPDTTDTGLYAAYAELGDARSLGSMGDISTPGGSGFTIEEAVTRALFEAVERYCGAFFDREKAVWGAQVSPAFLQGDDLPLYTDEQYRRPGWPFSPLRADSRVWWTPGVCLHTGETRYVPAALIYIPFHTTDRAECIGPSLSTGMASGWTWEEACLSGLYEVCERDAFGLMWAKRLTGPRLLPAPGSPLEADAERARVSLEAEVTFVDISNDLRVPTAIAVVRRRYRGRPIVAVGSAAKPGLGQACRKAFAEALSVSGALGEYLEGPDADWSPHADFSNVTDWKWHSLLYTRPEFQHELDFLTSSAEARVLGQEPECGEDLRSLAARLRPHFPQIVAVDLTTQELAEIPVYAVKIMAPHAVPLEPDHLYRRHALPRLHTCGSALNPLPHPFF